MNIVLPTEARILVTQVTASVGTCVSANRQHSQGGFPPRVTMLHVVFIGLAFAMWIFLNHYQTDGFPISAFHKGQHSHLKKKKPNNNTEFVCLE